MVARSSGPIDRARASNSGIAFRRPLQHQFLHVELRAQFRPRPSPGCARLACARWMVSTFSSWCLVDTAMTRAPGIVEEERGLLRCLGGINRNRDRAQGQRREIGDRPLRAILAEDGDAIAFANAPGFKRASHAHDAAVNLGGRDGHPAQDLSLQHDAVAAVSRRPPTKCRLESEGSSDPITARNHSTKHMVRRHCTRSFVQVARSPQMRLGVVARGSILAL